MAAVAIGLCIGIIILICCICYYKRLARRHIRWDAESASARVRSRPVRSRAPSVESYDMEEEESFSKQPPTPVLNFLRRSLRGDRSNQVEATNPSKAGTAPLRKAVPRRQE